MLKILFKQIFIITLLCLATGVVVLLINFESIKSIFIDPTEISSKEDYDLNDFPNASKLDITGTYNNLFKLKSESRSVTSLKEYNYDFIVVVKDEEQADNKLYCRDITELEDELLSKSRTEFNRTISLSEYSLEGTELQIDLTNLTEQTKGSFGDATRLLDCTINRPNDQTQVILIIILELIVAIFAIIVIFRNKVIFIKQHIHEAF